MILIVQMTQSHLTRHLRFHLKMKLSCPCHQSLYRTKFTLHPQLPSSPPFGRHPMILRQRKPNTTISHIKISKLYTSKNYHKINNILFTRFVQHVDLVCRRHRISTNDALPKQVLGRKQSAHIARRRKYLKSLTPAQRNTPVNGGSLVLF
jgi:hypothetical protein